MESPLPLLRQTVRRLLKFPGSTAIAIFAMALGIGSTAFMFAVLEGLFLRGLPFEDSENLVHLECNLLSEDIESMEVQQHDFEVWRRDQTSFEDLAGFTSGTMNLADGDVPDRLSGTWISANFLDLVGVEPAMGRGFGAEDAEPGAPDVVILAHHVWQQRYGGDPSVLGQTVRINAEPATLIGIMPEEFRFPVDQDAWMPLRLETRELPRGANDLRTLEVFGRLKAGKSIDQANVEMSLLASRLENEFPETNEGVGVIVQPYLEEFINAETRRLTGVMFAAVLLVLLIACLNVASLLIARVTQRQRELAIRSALGSSLRQAMTRVLAEAAVIASLGAVLGMVLAHQALAVFDQAIASQSPPFWVQFYIDGRTLAAVALFTFLASLIAGALPALQSARPDIGLVLSDSSRGSTSHRTTLANRSLVITQIAISAALLIGAALTVRSVLAAHSYDLVFDSEDLLVARAGLFGERYEDDEEKVAFFEQARRSLAEDPRVQSVAVSTVVPAETEIGAPSTRFERPGEEYDQPFQMPWARQVAASPGYFDALDVELLAGRDFAPSDSAEAPKVAIVNAGFAAREWPGENPVGKTVDLWMGEEAETEDATAGLVEVIGMVPDLRFSEFDDEDDQQGIYLPLAQVAPSFAWLIVETRGDPAAFAPELRQAVLAVDRDLPLYFVDTMNEVLEKTLFFPNLLWVLFGLFGLSALFLASVGLYGSTAFAVARRTQEMGVRLALGASGRDLMRMVLGQGLRQTLIGLSIGLVLGAGLSALLSSALFQVPVLDPVGFVAIPLLLIAVTITACALPALRASRVDPMESLRYD